MTIINDFSPACDLDDGGFEYFFHWLGVGMIPSRAVLRLWQQHVSEDDCAVTHRTLELLLLLWATLGFFLFSKSTSFITIYFLLSHQSHCSHRCTYPSCPWTFEVSRANDRHCDRHVDLVGQDIARRPNHHTKVSTPETKRFGQLSTQNFVNLFTYKYERQCSPHPRSS